ncbi:Methyltransferase type 11 [Kribbella flavida DSM 17836]|uniref:Methyltransferase type 11 n=1 Tax=Kribbella flavida (strain DSM 17836 / JCM 10339 / NBRC 14399) TaxID=479435 RepID=D2PN76_KRIFD|nr:class I SAM-dependent methyltransferase [Kribbella flavida]ADB34560.1 Methyltransferase type 11 [Kribbella flavida DSM 17836]
MADALFAEPRLARIYDPLEPERPDLLAYLAIAEEVRARSVLDVGCGTGTFSCLLAGRGIEVVGVDPAAASLEVAKSKEYADRVRWMHGDATTLPPLQVELATMTANVAQVFLTDEQWAAALAGVRAALVPGGRLVFETRRPERQGWLEWTREHTHRVVDLPGIGEVETWCDLVSVDLPFVSFRHSYVFASDGETLTSDSTLRFRSQSELEDSLAAAGFRVDDIREAPDRPGREFVVLATKL